MTFTQNLRCSSNKTWNTQGGQSNKISGWNVVLDLIRNVFLKACVTRMIVHCFSQRGPARIWNLSVIKLNVLIMVTITSHYNPGHQLRQLQTNVRKNRRLNLYQSTYLEHGKLFHSPRGSASEAIRSLRSSNSPKSFLPSKNALPAVVLKDKSGGNATNDLYKRAWLLKQQTISSNK